MPTATFAVPAHGHEVVPVGVLAAAPVDLGSGLEVWLCGVGGGPRIEQLPAEIVHDVSWSDRRGAQATATFTIDRYALVPGGNPATPSDWWVNRIHHDSDDGMSEIQIVWRGQVVHWGPVVAKKNQLGKDRAAVTVADPMWYFGRRITDSADQIWSLDRIKNGKFSDGLSHWRTGAGVTTESSPQETGGPSVRLDATEWIRQTVQVGLTPGWRCLVRARVWIEEAAVGGELRLNRSDLVQTIRKVAPVTADTPRGQWTWLAIDQQISNDSVLPALLDVEVQGPASGGTLWVDRVEMQAQPESMGLPGGQFRAPLLTPSLAAAALIGIGGDGVNIAAVTSEGGAAINAVWQQRNDMFVSEALRSLSDRDDGLEFISRYSPTVRAVEARQVVGVEHAPSAVTLRVVEGEGASGRGNATAVDVDQAVAAPTTLMRARSEEGFFDEVEDLSKWGGVRLEDVRQAPMGVGVAGLGAFARAHLMASEGSTEAVKLGVPDVDLLSVLGRGDRVPVVVDDGPSQLSGLYRIEGFTKSPGASPPMTVDLVPWVDPGPLPKIPRPAVAQTGYSLEAKQVSTERRVFDVERRLAHSPKVVDRLEDLLDTDVVYEGIDAVADGDVLTWDDTAQRWVGAAGGGGDGVGGSFRIDAEGGGSVAPGDPPANWTTTSIWSTVEGEVGALDGTGGAVWDAPPGTYIVSATFIADDDPITSCRIFTDTNELRWWNDPSSGPCFENVIRYEGGGVSAITITGQIAIDESEVCRIFSDQPATAYVTVHPVSQLRFYPCDGEPPTS